MKKVLALVLAIAMMSTVAFAASNTPWDDGTFGPGKKITIGSSKLNADPEKGDVSALNTDNYSIKKVTYNKGKAYIDSIELNDEEDDELVIKFKKDYTVEKAKEIDLEIELRGKGNDVDVKTVNIDVTAKYLTGIDTFYINEDNEISGYSETEISEFKSEEGDGAPYGTLEFDTTDGDTSVEVRVYDGDKLFLGHDYDADKKVLVANADSEAEISFLNFPAKPSFNSTATVYFYQVDEDGFVYELTGEGKIKKSAAKWSEDDGCWVLKTRTLGSYVFADKALTSAAAAGEGTEGETTNPDTGANDVVGIAAALAVVSLVAAGAVSLKK